MTLKTNPIQPPTVEECNELSKEMFVGVEPIVEGDSIYSYFYNTIAELAARVEDLEQTVEILING